MVKNVWVTDYKPLDVMRNPEKNMPIAKWQKIYQNAFEAHRQKTRVKYSSLGMPRPSARELDEYEAWMESPQATGISIQDLIQYWHDLKFKYSRLSRMALNFLTIQPMSAEVGGCFRPQGLW